MRTEPLSAWNSIGTVATGEHTWHGGAGYAPRGEPPPEGLWGRHAALNGPVLWLVGYHPDLQSNPHGDRVSGRKPLTSLLARRCTSQSSQTESPPLSSALLLKPSAVGSVL